MSRLSNVSTLKIGVFRSWNNYWFDSKYYANLLFSDLKIRDYLSGIFYKLKIISNYYYIYRLLNNKLVINTNLVFFSNLKFKSLSLRSVHKINPYIGFFYRKKYWFSFLRFLKMFSYFKNAHLHLYTNNAQSIYSSNTLMYYFSKVLIFFKTSSLHSNISFYLLQFKPNYNNYVPFSNRIVTVPSILINSLNLLEYRKSTIEYNSQYLVLNNTFLHANKNMYFNFFNDWYYLNIIRNYIFGLFMLGKFLYCYSSIVRTEGNILLNFINLPYIQSKSIMNKISHINLDSYVITTDFLPNFFLKRTISQSLFKVLRYQMESTISMYTQQTVYFNFSINLKQNPYLNSAKIITDTLVYLLQSGQKIVKSFFFIRNWQSDCYITRRTLEHLYNSKYSSCLRDATIDISYLFHYATKQSPLIGIRIECSGTFKKGKMSKVYFYNSWVKDDTLTGRMPNTSMIADIDYYQYVAVSKSSSLGVKTWIFLETHIYNNNHKYISLIY